MFRWISAVLGCLVLGLSLSTAQAANEPVEMGRDLYQACSTSAAQNPGSEIDATVRSARARCRNYLAGFVQASVITRTPSGMISPYSPPSGEHLCYNLPDELNWSEIEELVILFGDSTPDALDKFAADFLVEVFAAEFPCEEPIRD